MKHLTNYNSFDIVEPNQVRTYTISLAYTNINKNDQCFTFYLNKNIIEQITGSKYRPGLINVVWTKSFDSPPLVIGVLINYPFWALDGYKATFIHTCLTLTCIHIRLKITCSVIKEVSIANVNCNHELV